MAAGGCPFRPDPGVERRVPRLAGPAPDAARWDLNECETDVDRMADRVEVADDVVLLDDAGRKLSTSERLGRRRGEHSARRGRDRVEVEADEPLSPRPLE